MKIKVLEKVIGCFPHRYGKKSDCFDLYLGEDATLEACELKTFRLGVAMKLPKGFRANVFSRSSTPAKYKVMVGNSIGIIDNAYCGNDDEWRIALYAYQKTVIPKGVRIAQFEIVLSQFATFWDKLKWFFNHKVELERVTILNDTNRGGIGSTGN